MGIIDYLNEGEWLQVREGGAMLREKAKSST